MNVKPFFNGCAKCVKYGAIGAGLTAGAMLFARVTADAGIKAIGVASDGISQLLHPDKPQP